MRCAGRIVVAAGGGDDVGDSSPLLDRDELSVDDNIEVSSSYSCPSSDHTLAIVSELNLFNFGNYKIVPVAVYVVSQSASMMLGSSSGSTTEGNGCCCSFSFSFSFWLPMF